MKFDPHADETTVAIDTHTELLQRWTEARANASAWKKLEEELGDELLKAIGDADAATVNGRKVVTHRPRAGYNTTAIRASHPDLYERFVVPVTKETFDARAFAEAFPEIAQAYRSRALLIVK